jgi:UDP-glucose 4-epimerase
MNCVVIGGGGFIGSHLSESLLNQQNEVVVFDRPNAKYLNELAKQGASVITGNFLVKDIVKKALQSAEIVYHLVSTTVPKTSNENPVYDIETNLIGTINLFNIAKESGVKKIIFSSSGGTIYGIPKEIPISENHPTDPICSYGIVKLAIEKYLHMFWTLYGVDYCILRMSNAYGERQSSNGTQGIIPTIIDRGLHHQEINIWGDGTVIRDYIHVNDVVEAFLKASASLGPERIFNISSGQGHSVNEIIRMVEEDLHQPLRVIHTPGLASDVPINILDNTLARQILHWDPRINLSDGLHQTIEYMRDHFISGNS